jgi:hypothetical protein
MVNHFVSHSTNQNDKVQFDYPVALDVSKLIGLFFYTYHYGVFFKLENPMKKP